MTHYYDYLYSGREDHQFLKIEPGKIVRIAGDLSMYSLPTFQRLVKLIESTPKVLWLAVADPYQPIIWEKGQPANLWLSGKQWQCVSLVEWNITSLTMGIRWIVVEGSTGYAAIPTDLEKFRRIIATCSQMFPLWIESLGDNLYDSTIQVPVDPIKQVTTGTNRVIVPADYNLWPKDLMVRERPTW